LPLGRVPEQPAKMDIRVKTKQNQRKAFIGIPLIKNIYQRVANCQGRDQRICWRASGKCVVNSLLKRQFEDMG
jgi:hypothetical protein